MPSGTSPKSQRYRVIIGLLFLVAVLGGVIAGSSFALFVLSPLRQIQPDGVIIEIRKGQSPHELSHLLVSQGIIPASEERNFLFLGKVGRYWRRIKAGEYRLASGITPMQIFSTLSSGISIIHPITVREGENMYEIAQAIDAEGLSTKETVLLLCHDPKMIANFGLAAGSDSVEGYLFPDTYYFNKTMNAEDMLKQMHRNFATAWGPEQEARAHQLGFTPYQIITLASMIEKETGAASERPLISSVFHNRLRLKMRLQSDPTTIYGMWDHYKGNIHKSDLLIQNPFNTYTVPGLPVGPIANPGKESIQAALFPAQSDFLFFVSHNNGTHQFSHTYEEHQAAVRKFQLDPAAREGKSWRDLNPAEAHRDSAHAHPSTTIHQ
jgi:UPF0755 protein